MSRSEDAGQKPPIIVPLGEGEELVFRHIPAGTFRMGARGYHAREEPVTEVFVDEFWMGETPVTRGQYKILAGYCLEELVRDDEFPGHEPEPIKSIEDGKRPVTRVNWHDTQVIARWLTAKMRQERLLPEGYEVDLPSEAGWEKACRAGTETDYYSGDGNSALEEVGWFGEYKKDDPYPTKSKGVNGWGLSDCHGSVWQWCRDDWDGEEQSSRLLVPGGAEPRERSNKRGVDIRVLRGGSWNFTAGYCRSAYRIGYWPGDRSRGIGFRLAVVPARNRGQA